MRLRRVLWSRALWPLLSAVACQSPAASPPSPSLAPDEAALRHQLGIPDDAQQVLVFSQSSHLDIDWQRTFDDYYSTFVEGIFLSARKVLESQPRAYYSVAEMAYLEHHLAVHPEEAAALRVAAQRGALRIVGGGMTSPDTLLPETELLARDFLYGLAFAQDALGVRPKAAWLPDSFGHSAAAPDLLAAAGYTAVGFARIDGAPTLTDEIVRAGMPPRPGSTAELLQGIGSADFLWKGAGGASILAHFMPGFGLYCEGDNLDYDEGLQVAGGHLGPFHGDDPTFTDARIVGYLQELSPWAKTPYLFVPVGCDFQAPKEQLLAYLDGYNQRQYPLTKAWAVAASFEDYAALLGQHADALPMVDGELSPYYMGFYGSRADLKRGVRDAARPFFVAEMFATLLEADGKAIVQGGSAALSKLTRANHHDFVTGTSADPVVTTEQLPALTAAQAAGEAELAQVAGELAQRVPTSAGTAYRLVAFNGSGSQRSDVAQFSLPISAGVAPALSAVAGGAPVPMELVHPVGPGDTSALLQLGLSDVPPLAYEVIDLVPGAGSPPPARVSLQLLDAAGKPATGNAVTQVVLANEHVRAQWSQHGPVFALDSLTVDGYEAIARPSARINDYADDGGLWRLGNEMDRCALTALPPDLDAESVQVLQSSAQKVTVAFVSASVTREASLGSGATGLTLAVTTGAREATTRTVSFSLQAAAGDALRTATPGHFVERPAERIYTPTFRPAVTWASVGSWAILLRQSTGVRMSMPGELELMAARDARSERCDIEGGEGSDTALHRIEWQLVHVASPTDAERQAQDFNRPLQLVLVGLDQAAKPDLPWALSLGSSEGDALISAIKPAERGDGIIVRVLRTGPLSSPATLHLAPWLIGRAATLVDLGERDLRALGLVAEPLVLSPTDYGSIVSVRIQ